MRDLTPDLAPRLREALTAADFTVDAVRRQLGEVADAALLRGETTPALRRTGDGSPLATLTRLFLLQTAVPSRAAEAALPGLVDRLAAEGVLDQSVGEVAARLDVRPYAADDRDLWVVSDLTPGLDGRAQRVSADHVLGISSASTSLAQLTVRDPVDNALDLGTGCGVQALHLAGHAGRVVATDVNPRALTLTRFNAALNQVAARVETRPGSYFEPVAGERFDLITTNPPFVISPATGERLVYRDSGLPGDRVVEHVARAAPDHLRDGGLVQVLGNWVVPRDGLWEDRVRSWLPADADALLVQRELVDPAAYVELWLKDSGHHPSTGGDLADYRRRYDTWLSWFDDQGVEAIGFGWLSVRVAGATGGIGSDAGRVEALEWPYDVEQPIAPAIAAWFGADPAAVDATTVLALRADVRQETAGAAGAEDPESIVLRQQLGFRRARRVDTVEAALAGACDGDLPVGALLEAVAGLVGRDPAATVAAYLPVVRELVAEGFLVQR